MEHSRQIVDNESFILSMVITSMWFKNLRVFRLLSPFSLNAESLDQILKEDAFSPCSTFENISQGWVAPLGKKSLQFAHQSNGRLLVALKKEERILPASVIRDEVNNRVEVIEELEARSVGRKQRQELKEDVINELLPKAFTKASITYAYIDPVSMLVVVDTASAKRSEELVSQLRRLIDGFKLSPIQLKSNPATIMTGWLNHDLAVGLFEPQEACELKSFDDEGAIVRCRHQDLYADEIQAHLKAGKLVTQLALLWDERLRFMLDQEMTIKQLKFEDIVTSELEQLDHDDELMLFDAQFSLLSLELAQFIPALIEALGGEDSSAYPSRSV